MITGWKDIANWFGVSESTVKRWYYYLELPIGRTPTGRPTLDPEEAKRFLKSNENPEIMKNKLN